MPNATVIPVPERVYVVRSFVEEHADLPTVDPFPRIPAMAATMLQLELLLQDAPINLKAVADVILSDAGATLQILRLIGEEFPDEKDRPTRIEDCIASLDAEVWYGAIQQQSATPDGRLLAEWQGCRRVGEYARELTRHCDGISPDEAYVVGLLHRLGEFPQLLGWSKTASTAAEHYALGAMLAVFWQLPDFLVQAIQEQQTPAAPGRWTRPLNMARQLANVA